uniref:Serine aminopeptidase S33 domain-containing protein n=1 Tax=Aegilops tauschii subsp. strangulata TaxID=200361 RepID=A0A453FVW7_AEGTS
MRSLGDLDRLTYPQGISITSPMAHYKDDIKYEEGFTLNSRGSRLFTCKWAPKKQQRKALVFICHGYGGECSISMAGSTTSTLQRCNYVHRFRTISPSKIHEVVLTYSTHVQTPPRDWCTPATPSMG